MAVSSTGTYWIVVTQLRGTAAQAVLHDQKTQPVVQNTYAATNVQGPYANLSAALAQLKRLTITGSVTVVDSSSKVLGSVDVATGSTSTSAAAGGASQPKNPETTRTAVNTQDPGSGTGTSSPGTPATGTLFTQPAFAPQITATPSPIGTSVTMLQRGHMVWDQPMTSLYSGGGPFGDGRDVINFLFNPSTVNTDYNVGNVSMQAAYLYQVPGDNGNLLAPLQGQTVNWQLYFDRTFELLYGGDPTSPNDPGVIGVQADVLQFMQFTGVLSSLGSTSQANAVLGQPTTAAGATANAPTSGGIMMMIPCWVYFGNAGQQWANSGNTTANNLSVARQMAFYGFISEWGVEYTHWTQNMVPIRCVISVSFTMLPNPPQGSGTAAWQDVQKLQGTYVARPPFANGVTPPVSLFNTGG